MNRKKLISTIFLLLLFFIMFFLLLKVYKGYDQNASFDNLSPSVELKHDCVSLM